MTRITINTIATTTPPIPPAIGPMLLFEGSVSTKIEYAIIDFAVIADIKYCRTNMSCLTPLIVWFYSMS